ncbi:hypothetical protein AFLA_003929 [Aspergillus flavus NRRL3357]|nr:hypothetical protein AFLA_003929 [Aspergillus flavus NRRL3357]
MWVVGLVWFLFYFGGVVWCGVVDIEWWGRLLFAEIVISPWLRDARTSNRVSSLSRCDQYFKDGVPFTHLIISKCLRRPLRMEDRFLGQINPATFRIY